MNNTEQIKTLLDKISEQHTLVKPKHIFADLIKHFEHSLEKQNINSLFYYMSLSDKCLDNYRKRNIPLGDYYYNTLSQYTSFFISPITSGMLSLHDALTAYQYFVKEDYDYALSLLSSAVKYAENQWSTFPYFIIATSEQQLNKLRVYIHNKQYDELLFETSNVLFNLITNENVKFNILSYDQKFGMLQHIFNSIEVAVFKSYKTDNMVIEVFDDVVRMLDEKKISPEFSDLEMYIYYYLNLDMNLKKNPTFFHQIILEYRLPKSLKKILLFKINSISENLVSMFIEEQILKK